MISENGVAFARGTQVEMEFDEEQFVGGGVYLFASVLEYFLGLYVSMNSFSQLRVRTRQRKEVLQTVATPGRTENTAVARWPIVGAARTGAVSVRVFPGDPADVAHGAGAQVVGRFSNPATEVVRFAANPDVSFPASEIQSLERARARPAADARELHGAARSAGHPAAGPIANW